MSNTRTIRLTILVTITVLSVMMAINVPKITGGPANLHRLADTPWPMHKQNPQRTGQSPYMGITQPPAILWQSDLFTLYTDGITIGISDTVYATGWRHSFDLWTGDVKHSDFLPSSGCGSTPVHSQNGNFYYSHDFAFLGVTYDGELIFQLLYGAGCNGDSGVIDEDGILYTKTNDYGMLAIDLSTLEVLWQDPVSPFNNSTSPALGLNGTVYYNDYSGFIVARHRDGTFLWQSTDSYLNGHPVIADNGTVYAYSHITNNVSAFDPMTGSIQWHYHLTEPYFACGGTSQITIGPDGVLYFSTCSLTPGNLNLYLNALNPDGSLKWQRLVYAAEGDWSHFSRNSPVTDAAGNIYFCIDLGRCYAYDSDGHRLWDILIAEVYDEDDLIYPSPTIVEDGFVLLPSTTGIMAVVTAQYQTYLEPNSGDTLIYSSPDGFEVSVAIPAGSVTVPTQLVLSPMARARLLSQDSVYLPLHLLVYQDQSHIGYFTFDEPMHITITYDDTAVPANENGLALLHRTVDGWQPAEMTCPPEQRYKNLDSTINTLEIAVCQSGELALFDYHQNYLPLIIR